MARVVLTPTGGTSAAVMGAVVTNNAQMVSLVPQQLIGLTPLSLCAETHCRTYNGDCYIIPVFGDTAAKTATYENDVNSFFINDGLRRTIRYQLYKVDERLKKSILVNANMNSTYGTIYGFGSLAGHPYYAGRLINWGAILSLHGPGLYGISITSVGSSPNSQNRIPYCFVSEFFRLRAFSCDLAENTVKFEAYNSGMIGKIPADGVVFDLCGLNIYDSIRFKGFFGNEKTGYDETELEYQNGLIDPVNDEALQKYTLNTRLLPDWLHKRLKVYGLMADRTFVSDYNWSNPDHNIKRKLVRKNAGYEPKWNERNRQASVSVEFADGVQSTIKSISCP